MACNANGLREKKDEVAQLLLDDLLDELFISETWLRPGDRLSLLNYCIYRSDRPIGEVAERPLPLSKLSNITR